MKVLTIDPEYDSAQKLGYETYTSNGAIEKTQDVVIRWGNGFCPGKDWANVVNKASAIHLNIRKHESLKAMGKVVRTPTIWLKKIPKDVKAVLRPFEHSAGQHFQIVDGPYNIDPGWYATRYIKTKQEYRVWFAWDRTLCALRTSRTSTAEFPCRSNWGYRFHRHVASPLHNQTMKAVKAIGLELGAADVLYDPKTRKYYFLELNSAPTLDNDLIIDFFKKAIKDKFKGWKPPKKEKPEKPERVDEEPPAEVPVVALT